MLLKNGVVVVKPIRVIAWQKEEMPQQSYFSGESLTDSRTSNDNDTLAKTFIGVNPQYWVFLEF
jgi:hypothetical protein